MKHIKTNKQLELKLKGVGLSSYYILDRNGKRINMGLNIDGSKAYKVGVYLNEDIGF